MPVQNLPTAVAIAAGCALAASAHAQQYSFALDPFASGVTGEFSAVVGASGSLVGDWDPVDNPGGTRTKPTSSFFDFPGPNENLAVSTSVDLSASAPLQTQTAGMFGLSVSGASASVSGLAIDLLSGGQFAAPISAGVSYQSFSTRNPTSFYPSIPVTLPLGEATVSALTLTQAGPAAVGSVMQTGAFTSQVSALVPVVLSGNAMFQGQAVPIQDVPLTILFAGELTTDFGAATLSASFDFDIDESTMIDVALPDFPLALPSLTGGEADVILSLNADTLGLDANAAVNLLATGVVVPAPAGAMAFGVLLIRRRRRPRA